MMGFYSSFRLDDLKGKNHRFVSWSACEYVEAFLFLFFFPYSFSFLKALNFNSVKSHIM